MPEPSVIDLFIGQYRFLSNFYPSYVILSGVDYQTVEHAYQAAKTTDEYWRARIRACSTPGEAKRMGRTVPLDPNWDSVRLQIMELLLNKKFTHLELRSKLLATGSATLIEGNYWGDVFWGMYQGRGENHLGKLLMKIREEKRRTS